ncbi:hypothetical protein RS9917_04725 [Synechococcus sp. RS9917]|nr:hypothetical protein RS9917_04725 [Synechococcus sp. RS9917]
MLAAFSLLNADRAPFGLEFSDSAAQNTRFQAFGPAGAA